MQTAAYFQALSAEATIEFNVFFNGPRAGINFNDGFGGGNLVRGNLVFNQVCTQSLLLYPGPGPPLL
jgi:hypothetical protein